MTRNAVALLMIDFFDIFAQVSESCSDGCHLQDVQAVSAIILPGGLNQCWICCDSQIYCPARGHDIYHQSSVDPVKMLG